ncbi:MAG: nucleotidyltransferase family protein, partial [Halioglobus sp.]|nr:nucleotidyltransferase family protein [Halioglobus sp.]
HAAAAPLRGFLVHNDRYTEGMSTSLAAAINALSDVADAVLLMLADQPLVDRHHLANLRNKWLQQPDRIVASRYGGTLGVPAILPSSQFAGLLALRGDQGARSLIAAAKDMALSVDFEPAAVDIDEPADVARIPPARDRTN